LRERLLSFGKKVGVALTVFWIVAALFLLGALLFVLPGLWSPGQPPTVTAAASLAVHRDQWREAEADLAAGLIGADRLEQLRGEIQHRVLEDAATTDLPPARPARRTAWALALLIPLASVLTYLQLGSPQAVVPQLAHAATTAAAGRHSLSAEQIQQMVAALAERLKAQPNDVEGWLMLGRSYVALARYRDGATALRRAVDLSPGNATLLADLADVTGMAQGRRLAGEPARLVQHALDADPRHVKALALAGSVAFEAKDYAAARSYWQRLVAVLPPESPMRQSVQGSIDEATQLEGGGAAPAAPRAAVAASAAAGDAAAISGQVTISPELAARLAPGATLFVFARPAQGPRMPLAVLRQPATGAVWNFKLDDSLAMSPQFKLSGAAQVVVGARISASGNATPQAGDLVGQSEVVAPGASELRIVIDRVQP
jgi:cytochrome c-type biogenesis protein CcmH